MRKSLQEDILVPTTNISWESEARFSRLMRYFNTLLKEKNAQSKKRHIYLPASTIVPMSPNMRLIWVRLVMSNADCLRLIQRWFRIMISSRLGAMQKEKTATNLLCLTKTAFSKRLQKILLLVCPTRSTLLTNFSWKWYAVTRASQWYLRLHYDEYRSSQYLHRLHIFQTRRGSRQRLALQKALHVAVCDFLAY